MFATIQMHLFHNFHCDSDGDGVCIHHDYRDYLLAIMDNLGCNSRNERARGRGHGEEWEGRGGVVRNAARECSTRMTTRTMPSDRTKQCMTHQRRQKYKCNSESKCVRAKLA